MAVLLARSPKLESRVLLSLTSNVAGRTMGGTVTVVRPRAPAAELHMAMARHADSAAAVQRWCGDIAILIKVATHGYERGRCPAASSRDSSEV